MSNVNDIQASTQEIQEASRTSLDFLAALAMPNNYLFAFPPVFLAIWSWLIEYVFKVRDFSQLALGLPRGFGKTAVIKLFVLFTILFTSRKFILIISETESKAINIIADIADMLDEVNIKTVFGDWRLGLEIDTQKLKKFGFRGRNIVLLAAGANSGIRGITIKNERPDIMIFDDIQSREVADSQLQSEALFRWMVGTAMKAKSPHGCMFLFVANMYPTKWSILRQLKDNPNWVKFIAGGILEDGTSLWEALQPIEQLLKEFSNDLSAGRPDIFYAEVLNDQNASAHTLIDLSQIPPVPYAPGDISSGNFVIIDPSGNKARSDNVAMGYFEVYDTKPVLMKHRNAKMSPGETIREAIKLCLENNCHLVVIESVAFQASLCYWFDYICNQSGIQGIQAVEIYPGISAKNARILRFFQSYAKGEIFIAPECRPEVHLQITEFNPLRNDNVDDLLDLMCYAPKVLEMYPGLILAGNVLEHQNIHGLEVVYDNTPF